MRIFLVAEGFKPEITTTALYLRTLNLDITCLSLTPYHIANRTFIDVEQVIPLPETESYQIALGVKRAETEAAQARASKRPTFFLNSPSGTLEDLSKRRLILELAKLCAQADIAPDNVAQLISWRAKDFTLSAPGKLNGPAVVAANPGKSLRRWFVKPGEEIVLRDRTYVISTQWGSRTEEAAAIISAMLDGTVRFGPMQNVDG